MDFNIWGIALVVGIVAMVLGPVLMLQPNSSQRRQEKLRTKALSMGLKVSMRPLPKASGGSEAGTMVPVYTLLRERDPERFDGWLLVRLDYDHGAHFQKFWEWQERKQANAADKAWLEAELPGLPKSVLAVGASIQGLHFYWTEAGGDVALDYLKAAADRFPS